jgi:succinate dehydrogenase/fumarate reductase flavoprotein subunit
MNACCPNNSTSSDYRESFFEDTKRSAGSAAQPELIRTLVDNSAAAVTFLKDRVGVDLSLIAQLGGHSHKRTHRPKNGMVGAEIIYGMQRAVKEYEKSGQVQILTDTKVLNLLKNDDGSVIGVEVEYLSDGKGDMPTELYSPNTILATGGFAADRTKDSYLSKYRPELMKMAATAGSFSTGDGIGLATDVGAGLVDMDKVQVHPTGWVDPRDPSNPNKVLAAELMRGVGGLLINGKGKR